MKEITLTQENFEAEVLKSDIPVLVDFWAEWCGPCQMLGPVVEQLAEESDGKYKVGKVNVDDEPDLAQEYDVYSIPTVLIFFGDIRVVLDCLSVNTVLVLSCELKISFYLLEHRLGCLTNRALLRSIVTLIYITAYFAYILCHRIISSLLIYNHSKL